MLSLHHHRYIELVEEHMTLARRALDEDWFPEDIRPNFEKSVELVETIVGQFINSGGDDQIFGMLQQSVTEWNAINDRLMEWIKKRKGPPEGGPNP